MTPYATKPEYLSTKMWFCGSEMTAAWFCDTCTTVKPWKVMTVSDTANQKFEIRAASVGPRKVCKERHLRPRVPLYVRAHQLRNGKAGYRPGFVSSLGMPP